MLYRPFDPDVGTGEARSFDVTVQNPVTAADASSAGQGRMIPGFGNHVATEAVAGALPIGRNSPQHVPYGLFAEQLSGTAFTAPLVENRRSWLYRLRPTATHPAFQPY